MEARKRAAFLALFYPYSVAAIAAGFLTFVMIILKLDLPLISTVVLWFYFACVALIYSISKKALEMFGMQRFLLGFIIVMGTFAVLSTVIFVLEHF